VRWGATQNPLLDERISSTVPCCLRVLRVSVVKLLQYEGGKGRRTGLYSTPIVRTRSSVDALHTLLEHSIDYAGLFPPAGLDMGTAVRNYAAYRETSDEWALGRFVVPVSRLEELEKAATRLPLASFSGAPWRLSALLGAAISDEVRQLEEFNCRHAADGAGMAVDVVELKAESVESITASLRQIPSQLQAYVEIPIESDPVHLVSALRKVGARAKVRTGGVTPEAFPRSADVVRFLQRCVQEGVPFKATAGLHHPLRAEYRLTYAPSSPSGTMYGFLNLFLAAGFIQAGMDSEVAIRLLEERSLEAFRFAEGEVTWRGHRLERERIASLRQDCITAFGSCSFTEPIADLRALGLLH
jgi:hypothetical protein